MEGPAASRLAVLSRQLTASCSVIDSGSLHEGAQLCREHCSAPNTSLQAERPLPGGGRGTLTVVDNRTGKKYTVRAGGVMRGKCFSCSLSRVTPWLVSILT